MKIRNDDLKKITEIKQYLPDPPVTFKLYDYAVVYIENAISVLATYPDAKDVTVYLQELAEHLKSRFIAQGELRNKLKEAGIKISKLTSK